MISVPIKEYDKMLRCNGKLVCKIGYLILSVFLKIPTRPGCVMLINTGLIKGVLITHFFEEFPLKSVWSRPDPSRPE